MIYLGRIETKYPGWDTPTKRGLIHHYVPCEYIICCKRILITLSQHIIDIRLNRT